MSTLAKMWLPVGAIGCLFAVATPAVPRASTPAPGAATVPAAAARPAAIVLVTVDTLRADRVSFDGYRFPTTPFLDRLAIEGVVFERAYSAAPHSSYSLCSMMTSEYLHETLDLGQPLPELCLARRITGSGCTGCGMTRSFISIMHGDLAGA